VRRTTERRSRVQKVRQEQSRKKKYKKKNPKTNNERPTEAGERVGEVDEVDDGCGVDGRQERKRGGEKKMRK